MLLQLRGCAPFDPDRILHGNGLVGLPQVSPRRVVAVVDDDQSVRRATAKLLSLSGYEVHSFSSAADFLRSEAFAQFECLVSDVRMPQMGGLQLYDRVIELGRRIPVIFVTAYPQERERERAFAAGATGFLAKPFDGQVLIDLIEQAFGAPK